MEMSNADWFSTCIYFFLLNNNYLALFGVHNTKVVYQTKQAGSISKEEHKIRGKEFLELNK
jgi:hypothetical protein